MTRKEVLTLALRKAADNGWAVDKFDVTLDGSLINFYHEGAWGGTTPRDSLVVLFSHDFAKALWGSVFMLRYGEDKYPYAADRLVPAWQYHLQQIVIADDPIWYLAEHVAVDHNNR